MPKRPLGAQADVSVRHAADAITISSAPRCAANSTCVHGAPRLSQTALPVRCVAFEPTGELSYTLMQAMVLTEYENPLYETLPKLEAKSAPHHQDQPISSDFRCRETEGSGDPSVILDARDYPPAVTTETANTTPWQRVPATSPAAEGETLISRKSCGRPRLAAPTKQLSFWQRLSPRLTQKSGWARLAGLRLCSSRSATHVLDSANLAEVRLTQRMDSGVSERIAAMSVVDGEDWSAPPTWPASSLQGSVSAPSQLVNEAATVEASDLETFDESCAAREIRRFEFEDRASRSAGNAHKSHSHRHIEMQEPNQLSIVGQMRIESRQPGRVGKAQPSSRHSSRPSRANTDCTRLRPRPARVAPQVLSSR